MRYISDRITLVAMNRRTQKAPSTHLNTIKLAGIGILLHFSLSAFGLAHANSDQLIAGVIDEPVVANTAASKKEQVKVIKKEQRELAKLERQELKERAKNGERLAQVALGSDFANEAQKLLFAPAAANAAMSDALAWYSLAAKRGFPGAPSLNTSGVTFFPIRAVRSQ